LDNAVLASPTLVFAKVLMLENMFWVACRYKSKLILVLNVLFIGH
jgi:hypothetical protein